MTTVYHGARILAAADRAEADDAWAEALVVDGDTIAYVGTEDAARAAAGADAEIVDLGGALVLPGFLDVHTHLLMMGEALGAVPLTDSHTIQDIQAALRAARAAAPDAPRLFGRGWLFDSVPGGAPTAAMIDEAVADVPVYLQANDYHSCWVNSAAIAELGITGDTPDPLGGSISRREDGSADGMFYETAAQQIVWPFLDEARSDADREKSLERAFDAYLAVGVTGAVDMAFGEKPLAALDRIARRRGGTLPLTVLAHWWIHNTGDDAANLAQVDRAIELSRRADAPWLRIAGIKLIIDGVIDACTATMNRPYTNGSNAEPIWPLECLEPVVAAADAAGLQIAIHAIGDGASDIAVDALEHAVARNGERVRRHRIEHLEYTSPETPARMARLGATASMQPVHADPAIWDNWAAMVGPERARRGFAWPEFLDAGVRLAFSTDAPTAPYPALANLFIAATRRSAADPTLPAVQPEFALPLADAIAHSTRDAAASCFEEHRRGSLAPGMKADFAVIDRDPFTLGAEALLEARVLRTVVGGRLAYEAED